MPDPEFEMLEVALRVGATMGDGPEDADRSPDRVYCDEGTVTLTPLLSQFSVLNEGVTETFGKTAIEGQISTGGRVRWAHEFNDDVNPKTLWVQDLTSAQITPRIDGEGAATHSLRFSRLKARGIPVTIGAGNVRIAADRAVAGRVDVMAQLGAPAPVIMQLKEGPKGDKGDPGADATNTTIRATVSDDINTPGSDIEGALSAIYGQLSSPAFTSPRLPATFDPATPEVVTGTSLPALTAGNLELRGNENNVGAGFAAQRALTTGTNNVGAGFAAQLVLTTGTSNVGVGSTAQYSLTTGSDNVGIGRSVQQSPLGNTAFGTTTGTNQTSIGSSTGQNTATQLNDITTIGYRATAGANAATALGTLSRADHAGSVALGSSTQTTAPNQVMAGPRDVEITDTTKGVVIKSPDGTRYRIKVANGGALSTSPA